MNKITVTFFCLLCFLSCQTNKLKKFYNDEMIPISDYYTLESGQTPLVIETNTLEDRLNEWKNKNYVVLGSSYIYDRWVPRAHLVTMAIEKNASIVIVSAHYRTTDEHVYTVPVTTTQTNQHTGTIYTPNGAPVNYIGTTTTHSTDYAQFSYYTALFDQKIFFLAKKKQ